MTTAHFHALRVAELKPETDAAIVLRLEIPDQLRELFRHKQGQHLIIRKVLDGVELRPTYSILSAAGDDELWIAIKRQQDGRFSNWANDELKVGDSLDVMPPEGSFRTELSSSQKKSYLAFAVGKGITPILSILKTTLLTETRSRFTLVYANARVADIMFREELFALKNRYPDRFELVLLLSQESQDADVLNGHLDAAKLKALSEHIIEPAASDDVFICAPQSVTEALLNTLPGMGLQPEQIHFELFGTEESIAPAKRPVDKKAATGTIAGAGQKQVTVVLDGIRTQIEMEADGEAILDAALDAGLDAPFACKGGVCSTCRAKVVEGDVSMDVCYALEDDEIEAGFILTCQAHPISDRVVVDYDEI